MKSPNYVATAVRTPKGTIKTTCRRFVSWTTKPVLKWPFIRGIVSLVEMIKTGIDALTWSSNEALGETEEKFSTTELVLSLALAIIFAIAIFKLLPLGVAQLFNNLLGIKNITFNIIDGVIKAGMFILYLFIISRFKDMKRIFAYHGAEHKTIHCYELKKELTVKNVRQYTTAHTRCGTTFILSVLVLSIVIYILIPFSTTFWEKLIYRLVLLPVIIGISYELMKLTSRFHDELFFKIIAAPGLWLQRLTTNEPDDSQIEVAIASLRCVLNKEKAI